MARNFIVKYSLIVFLLLPALSWASPPSRVYTYVVNTTIDPDKVMANEDVIFNYLSVGVDKYFAGSIVNADISGSAAIADTKLAQITTAGKVANTSLTGTISPTLLNAGTGASQILQVNSTGVVPLSILPAGTSANQVLLLNSTAEIPQTIISGMKGVNATYLRGYVVSTSATASQLYVSDASGYMPDNTTDTTALKTATVEVTMGASTAGQVVFTGAGTYGFMPQIKSDGGNMNVSWVNLAGDSWADYRTCAYIQKSSGGTGYMQMRYVTASGEDLWIFLLTDKITGDIISSSCAPDHPSYGNGGNITDNPHPFMSYDSAKQNIIFLSKEQCLELKQESEQTHKSILTLVNQEYKVDMTKEDEYVPLHSGKFIYKDGKRTKEMVERLPSYITVRSLKKMTTQEKLEKKQRQG